MFEQLLSQGKPYVPETGDVLMYVNMATLTETISGRPITTAGGAVVDNTFLIDGKPTLRMPNSGSSGSRFRMDLSPALDLSKTNWTIEWTVNYITQPGTWTNEFYLTEATYYKGVMLRFADGGWDNLLMFSDNATNNASTARVAITPASRVGQTVQYALVCRNGRLRLFANGIMQQMRPGTNSNPSPFVDYFDVQTVNNFAGLTQLNIGAFAAAAINSSRYLGNIRISNYARYVANYTPGVI